LVVNFGFVKLVVLGSGTSVFHPLRASAAFWLQTSGGSILLDCSADAPHRMAQEKLDWPNLDAIWISHLHLDHCGGLAPFLFGIKWAPQSQQRRKPLKIFGCEGIRKLLNAIDGSHSYKLLDQNFAVEIDEITASDSAQKFELLPKVTAHTFSTPHRPESLAIRIQDSTAASLVYSSDTGFSEELAEFASGVDLLILECSFYKNKPVLTHLELSEAMRMAEVAAPKQLVLTHLYPEWDAVDLEAEAAKLWRGTTIAAHDGLQLKF
jgi:ribonuclease BN (tRNA processing enzyme)